MILKQFLENPENTKRLRNAIDLLRASGAFGLFLDIGTSRNAPVPNSHPMEVAALRASWIDGYSEALRDIEGFFERYKGEKPATEIRKMDFGAATALLNTGEINQDEFAKLTNRSPVT